MAVWTKCCFISAIGRILLSAVGASTMLPSRRRPRRGSVQFTVDSGD